MQHQGFLELGVKIYFKIFLLTFCCVARQKIKKNISKGKQDNKEQKKNDRGFLTLSFGFRYTLMREFFFLNK